MTYRTVRSLGVGLLMIILAGQGALIYYSLQVIEKEVAFLHRQHQLLSEVTRANKGILSALQHFDRINIGHEAEFETVLQKVDPAIEFMNHLRNKLEANQDVEVVRNIDNVLELSRRFKTALISYAEEIAYDPASDASVAIERLIYESRVSAFESFGRLRREIFNRVEQAEKNVSEAMAQSRFITYWGVLVGLITGALVVTALARFLDKPVRKLIKGSRELARGNYNFSFEYQSSDEIGRLFQAFNAMAETLRENSLMEERLYLTQFAIDHSSDAAYWMGSDARFFYVNDAACRTLGYSRQELLEMTVHDIDINFPKEIWPEHWEKMKEMGAYVRESMHRRKDGSTLPVEMTINHLSYDNREFHCAFARDISDRKRAEEVQKQLESQLQMAQKMEAIGTLAGGVAHDLNNILSGIVSYPDLLLLELPEDSELRDPVITMQESGKKAAAIVQDLLTLARRGVQVNDVVNLNHVIGAYLSSPEFKKLKSFHPDVEIEAHLASDVNNIIGSSIHLSKTIMNLVSNAVEAMPDGGITAIRSKNIKIQKPIEGYESIPPGRYVLVEVSDTGIGISAEENEKIFEPFYTKKVMGRSGTGLGMAVVWGTIKDHDGFIDMISKPGKGTSFRLYFPITYREQANRTDSNSIARLKGRGESILVVDDVKEQRKIASAILNKLGYEVDAVASGEDAVAYLGEKSVDLVLLDMIMDPGMDGLKTYRKITDIHPGQRALIASGYSETERVKEIKKLGAGDYIRKPYTLDQIGAAVKKALKV